MKIRLTASLVLIACLVWAPLLEAQVKGPLQRGTTISKRVAGGGGGVVGSDNFNRADESPLAGNWTQREDSGNINLVSNAFEASTGADCAAYWNAASFNDNQYAQIVLSVSASSSYVGPMVRCATGSIDYYAAFTGAAGDNNIYVSRWDGGTETNLASRSYTPNATDTIRLEASGSATVTLRVYVNGVQQGADITDSSGSRKLSGRAGIWAFAPDSRGDTWEGGNL